VKRILFIDSCLHSRIYGFFGVIKRESAFNDRSQENAMTQFLLEEYDVYYTKISAGELKPEVEKSDLQKPKASGPKERPTCVPPVNMIRFT